MRREGRNVALNGRGERFASDEKQCADQIGFAARWSKARWSRTRCKSGRNSFWLTLSKSVRLLPRSAGAVAWRELEVFGSAARDSGFDASRSDADFLVTFAPAARTDVGAFIDLKAALEELFGRSVDLVEREAIEASGNYIRRRAILKEALTIYG
jgi:uncharacterized protein